MKKLYFFLGMMMVGVVGWGQMSITSTGTPFTENFDVMGSSGTATLPTGFRIGTDWTTGTTLTTLAYGTTGAGVVTGASAGGIINWANGVTASATDRSLGFLTSGGFTSPRSIMLSFTNNTGVTITTLDIAFDYEKSRSGSRQFDWTFFHGNTSTATTAASAGNQTFPADANNTTVFNPPTTTSKNVNLTGLSIANGTSYYLRWTFTGLAGSTNGQGIGLDNFSIIATAGASNSITTGAVTTPPFCIEASNSASGTVAFTSIGTFAGETFEAFLSDVAGNFPGTSIGTTTATGTDPSGTINITIPAGTTSGGVYKIRIEEATIPITGSESATFAIVNGVTNNVTGLAGTNGNAQTSVSWTNPTNCFSEVMIVATAGSPNSGGTPTGDGTLYNANLLFGAGDVYGNGFVVYKGSTSAQVVTGLANGTTYYFKVFTRFGTSWSNGDEVTATPQAPTVYTWTGGNSTWNTPGNWTPTRNTPAVSDILQFNGGGTVIVTSVPTETFGQLLLSNNSTVNLQAGAASNILTIGGDAGVDMDVPAGSALNIDGANTLTITLLTGATGAIAGNMIFSNAAHKMDAADASSISFSSPAVFTQGTGCTGNVFTNTGTASVITFGTGTIFVQNAGSNPFGLASPNSKVVFQTGSLFRMQQNTALSMAGRTYANLEINFNSFSQNQTGTSLFTVDNLTVNDGTLNINLTGSNVNIKGNILVAAGEVLTFSPASASTITFNGTSLQTITNNGTLTFGANASVEINKPSGSLVLNTNVQMNNLTVLASNTLDLNGQTLSMTGFMTNGGTLFTNLGTVDFTGTSGTQTLTTGGTGAGKTFYNLSHSGASTLELATNDLRVTNHFTNNAGPFTGNNLNLTVGGDFSSTATYTPGTGNLTFDGTANQAWSNNPANTYHNVIINKATGTVTLNNDVTLNNSAVLTLTDGKFILGSNNLIISNTSAFGAIAYSNSGSYVITNGTGALERAVTGTGPYIFPVGYSTLVQLAAVNFEAPLSGPNTLAVRFITGWGGGNGLPLNESGDNIDGISVIGYWEILAGSPITESYYAGFFANSFGDILDYTKLHLLKRDNAASSWVINGNHLAPSGPMPVITVQRNGMTGFSQFAIGGEKGVALPVTVLHFSGYKDGSRNQLRWTTVTETNNRGFEVLRSTDGINFSPLGFVNSLAPGGNSNDLVNYTFTDNAPAGSKQYYRLRQEDLGGASRLSNIVLIRGGKAAGLAIDALFPNPAKNYVNLQVSSPESGKITVIVTDMAGRNMMQQVTGIGAGSNTLALDVSALQRGMYLVRITGSDGIEAGTVRFVK